MTGSENHHWWYLEEFLRIFFLSEMVDVASPALKSYFLGNSFGGRTCQYLLELIYNS